MKKEIILAIFAFLKSKGIATTESEFSTDWLGCCEGYMRKLRQTKSEPSMGAIAICASRLLNAAEQLGAIPRYQHLAKQMAELSGKCRELVDADSVEFDLAA